MTHFLLTLSSLVYFFDAQKGRHRDKTQSRFFLFGYNNVNIRTVGGAVYSSQKIYQ